MEITISEYIHFPFLILTCIQAIVSQKNLDILVLPVCNRKLEWKEKANPGFIRLNESYGYDAN